MTVVNDTYTGHVDAGTAARRTLPAATIVKASVGPMDNNAYLITCSATGKTLLIDAANDGPALVELIKSQAPDVELIVTSHQHFDHWQALAEAGDWPGLVAELIEQHYDPLYDRAGDAGFLATWYPKMFPLRDGDRKLVTP